VPGKIWRSAFRFLAPPLILLALVSPFARAQQAGVLLGYSEMISDGGYNYKTMWIVFTPDEARVAATVPDLIVPRDAGFWRIGRVIVCEFDEAVQRDTTEDVIWQSPLEKTPEVPQGPACKSHTVVDPLGGNADENLPASDNPTADLCGHSAATLLFVSPTYLAENFDDWDRCEARGGHDTKRDDVHSLDDEIRVSLQDLFGDQATKEYSAAVQKGFVESQKDYNCPEPTERYDLKSWNITHLRGAWRPAAADDEFMGECVFIHAMNLPLPKRVTGESPKPAPWSLFARAIPHLSDFYLSPLGDYALALVSPKNADYHLYAYSVKNGAPDKRLAEIPWENYNSRPIVMAQWSSGKYVAAWTDAIQKITEHPPAVPVVRVLAGIPKTQ